MSMIEPNEGAAQPKQKPKRRPRQRKRAAPSAPKHSGDLDGLSPTACPAACTAERCVISGAPVCSHPLKCGLQSSLMTPQTLARVNEAKRLLGKRLLDLRFA